MIELSDLEGLPLFADVEREFLARIASEAADVRVDAGQYVVHEGETTGLFVLLEGRCEVTKRVGRQERVLIERETRGDYFGELPLLFGALTFASLRSKSAARLARFEPVTFQALVAHVPGFVDRMLATVNERVKGVREAVVEMPIAVVTVLGRRSDRACHDIRDFLSRNQITFVYFDIDDACARNYVPEIDAYRDRCPIVKVRESGRILCEPTIPELAEAVGLQTRPHAADYDVGIVGGGPAGLAAAVYGASEGLRTVLFECQAPGGQAGTSSRIENYLGFPNGLSGDELASRALAQATRFGAELIVTRAVCSIDVIDETPASSRQMIHLDDGTSITTRAVVLSTGVSWRELGVPGIERYVGTGVFYGAARTEAARTQGEDIYLVGAGNSAGQAAMYFSDYARNVTLLVRGDAVEKSMSDYLIKELSTKRNVHVEVQAEIVSLAGENGLECIEIRDRATGETAKRETHFVFVFIGADAETAWLPEQIARDERGYVITGLRVPTCDHVRPWPLERDPFHLETSVPGIFAVGDVRSGSVKRCASAVGEGSMAIAFAHQHFEAQATQTQRTAVGAAS